MLVKVIVFRFHFVFVFYIPNRLGLHLYQQLNVQHTQVSFTLRSLLCNQRYKWCIQKIVRVETKNKNKNRYKIMKDYCVEINYCCRLILAKTN